jgi:hypothetical protein
MQRYILKFFRRPQKFPSVKGNGSKAWTRAVGKIVYANNVQVPRFARTSKITRGLRDLKNAVV